jgi:excinuclease ABC subunit A
MKTPETKASARAAHTHIALRGLRQNNLRGVDLDLPVGQLIAITGVSGSGKSSLAFDTLHAEGQRRYVECLSSYARQFMQRLPKPQADSIEGILPSVALEQGKRLRASRATVATLTEVLAYLKIVFAARAVPQCPGCDAPMQRTSPPEVADEALRAAAGRRAMVTFEVAVPMPTAIRAARDGLTAAGYHRALRDGKVTDLAALTDDDWLGGSIHVLQDRLKLDPDDTARLHDSVDQAMRRGDGVVDLWLEGEPLQGAGWLKPSGGSGKLLRYRATRDLRCLACDRELPDPSPSLFSYNSPLGACEHCNGFGRVMRIDRDRCIPDPSLTLRGTRNSLRNKAIKPWSGKKAAWERRQLYAFCDAVGIDTEVPWSALPDADKERLFAGHKGPGAPRFVGLNEWFAWLERRSYRMHVRVQLARYRAYAPCPQCEGTRLKPESLAWRLHDRTLPQWLAEPLAVVGELIAVVSRNNAGYDALKMPLASLLERIGLLNELGLDYLSLDRAGRTLSGGELQRVRLASALASGMSQVLYILDEPSVGLHPRDNDRLLGILQRLRDTGNTVAVVEHDPALVGSADYIVDLGPGAGEHGGEVVFSGPAHELVKATGSLTADYLLGRRRIGGPAEVPADIRSPVSIAKRARQIARKRAFGAANSNPWLVLRGVRARNLQDVQVRLKRGALNAICGVSGSGKSTLLEDVLMRQMLRRLGRPTEPPAHCDAMLGFDSFDDVALIVQAPVAGSSRANCATYLKVWDAIRRRLAAAPLAKERGYTASTFSFNTKGGRCPACDGAGAEVVDMQFLSDVRIECQACGGDRFARDVLEVQHGGRSVADFLAMTASEVAIRFADDRSLARPMNAMCELGLGYLRLGQSLSTLSGGESQRLKIAHHLLCARTSNALLLLDEPTTGLHLADVDVLLQCLRRLVDAGNTVVVIEHHLDVLDYADHLVELGPGGGPHGGQVVYTGPPRAMLASAQTATADYMRRHHELAENPANAAFLLPRAAANAAPKQLDSGVICIRGARVHNLRGIDVDVPRDGMTVVTGLSGSGKSSLAFDAVHAEGQRRFLDCLSPYARQYLPPVQRPDVDRLDGLPPTIAISQRTTRGGLRSTVGTLTDIYPYLRLLYARCGSQRCPTCGDSVSGRSAADIAAAIRARFKGAPLYVMTPLIRGRKGHHRDVIAKQAEQGRRHVHVDGRLLPTRAVPQLRRYNAHDIDEVVARLTVDGSNCDKKGFWRKPVLAAVVERALEHGDGTLLVRQADSPPLIFARDRYCSSCDISVEAPDPQLFSFTSSRGWCPDCEGRGVPKPEPVKAKKKRRGRKKRATKSASEQAGADFEKAVREGEGQGQRVAEVCPGCMGSRIRPEARAITVGGFGIDALTTMTGGQLAQALRGVKWSARDGAVAAGIVAEVISRCAFLERIGLSYLALSRGAVSLSGGESQRIRLSAQLSSNLRGVLYVLDEPSIGLHTADNKRLLDALDALKKRGNGLLVIEHDEATIRRADRVIELGPGGGEHGGHVICTGTLAELVQTPSSPTGAMLRDRSARRSRSTVRPPGGATEIFVAGACRNNLANITAKLLRGRLNVVSGVSGSGKSTLVRDLLVREGMRLLEDDTEPLQQVAAIEGLAGVGRIVEVDQSPIGRTPRSCPATYLKVFGPIRKHFASLPDAKVLGLTAGKFSFNVSGGRCEGCSGAGVRKLEMSFLPAGFIPCELCNGLRYDARTLQVRHRGASIADVLNMSIEDAAGHFCNIPAIARPLSMANRVGLGYLRLGQGSNTLSGGEAQRIKIVSELAKRRRFETIYVLDEPTTGLHLADQRLLMDVLHDLVDRGDTLVVIEHNLDLLAEADWLVDLGPGGGEQGGEIVWQGSVAGYIASALQHPTAQALRQSSD